MRQSGKSTYEAAIEAADEIGLAVVATTFSIIAVFMPVGFMPRHSWPVLHGVRHRRLHVGVLLAGRRAPADAADGRLPHEADTGRRSDEPSLDPALSFAAQAGRCAIGGLTIAAGIAFFAALDVAGPLPAERLHAGGRSRRAPSSRSSLRPGSTLAETDAVVRKVIAVLTCAAGGRVGLCRPWHADSPPGPGGGTTRLARCARRPDHQPRAARRASADPAAVRGGGRSGAREDCRARACASAPTACRAQKFR